MATRFFEGDIFEVPLGPGLKGYFQYLGKDSSQIGGAVIRAFKNHYNENESPDVVQIVESPVDFHTHTVLQWGIKDKLWKKIGREKVKGNANEILFRDSDDYGDSSVKVSKRWRVWRVGGQRDYVGELKGEHRLAEIGSVFPPSDVVERMKTGRSNYFYPQFE
jgi:Immunity protein 26